MTHEEKIEEISQPGSECYAVADRIFSIAISWNEGRKPFDRQRVANLIADYALKYADCEKVKL